MPRRKKEFSSSISTLNLQWQNRVLTSEEPARSGAVDRSAKETRLHVCVLLCRFHLLLSVQRFTIFIERHEKLFDVRPFLNSPHTLS